MEQKEQDLTGRFANPVFESEPIEREQWPPRLLQKNWMKLRTFGSYVRSRDLVSLSVAPGSRRGEALNCAGYFPSPVTNERLFTIRVYQ